MKALSRYASVLILLFVAAAPAMAAPLNVVNTSAPQIHCVFNTSCTSSPTDYTSTFLSGGAFIQSRYYQAAPGSPMAGKWVYKYRVSMTNEVGVLNIPYVTALRVPFVGLKQGDYNFDSVFTDHVFNVSAGGIGTKGVTSAATGSGITFNFASAIAGGSFAGDGESSYFFGVVSDWGPRTQYGTVYTSNGNYTVTVVAPYVPIIIWP